MSKNRKKGVAKIRKKPEKTAKHAVISTQNSAKRKKGKGRESRDEEKRPTRNRPRESKKIGSKFLQNPPKGSKNALQRR